LTDDGLKKKFGGTPAWLRTTSTGNRFKIPHSTCTKRWFFFKTLIKRFFYNSNSISNNFYGFNRDSDSFSVGFGHRNGL
jgi:hypothetical protein